MFPLSSLYWDAARAAADARRIGMSIIITGISESEEQKFWSKVEILSNGCWLWKGYRQKRNGVAAYGGFRFSDPNKRWQLVHRWAYEYCVGQIPYGLTIDHLCRNTGCVNPNHLEAVTNRENVRRGNGPTAINARKAFCIRGHPLDGDNLIKVKLGRQCRLCTNMLKRRWYLANQKT